MKARVSKERRLYPRRPIHTQVIFENEDSEGVLYFFSKDISEGGIFIEALDQPDNPILLGSQVFLRFNLTPGSKPIQATGEIVRVMRDQASEGRKSKVGLGIQFVYIHPLDRQLIHDFIGQTS